MTKAISFTASLVATGTVRTESGGVIANVQLQPVSSWVANRLGRSIDKPRNLAKSVTVE